MSKKEEMLEFVKKLDKRDDRTKILEDLYEDLEPVAISTYATVPEILCELIMRDVKCASTMAKDSADLENEVLFLMRVLRRYTVDSSCREVLDREFHNQSLGGFGLTAEYEGRIACHKDYHAFLATFDHPVMAGCRKDLSVKSMNEKSTSAIQMFDGEILVVLHDGHISVCSPVGGKSLPNDAYWSEFDPDNNTYGLTIADMVNTDTPPYSQDSCNAKLAAIVIKALSLLAGKLQSENDLKEDLLDLHESCEKKQQVLKQKG